MGSNQDQVAGGDKPGLSRDIFISYSHVDRQFVPWAPAKSEMPKCIAWAGNLACSARKFQGVFVDE